MAIPPVTSAADLNSYARLKAIAQAVRQRALASGQFFWWPPQSRPFFTGTVPAGITETAFDDAGQNWDTSKDDPWNHLNKTALDEVRVPSSWYLQIDDCDPVKVVKTAINFIENGGGGIGFENIRDYVTSGRITSIASLETKTYYIIRGDYGLTWADRYPEYPDARPLAVGTVREYHDDPLAPGTLTNPTDHSIKDDGGPGGGSVGWRAAELVGQDLLLYGTDADGTLLRRVTVTAASDQTRIIEFAAVAWTVVTDSPFSVVAAGDGPHTPGRKAKTPFVWNRGYMRTFLSHDASIAKPYIRSLYKPASTFVMPGLGTGTCDGYIVDAFDVDLIEHDPLGSADADCPGPAAGKHHTQDIAKSWRFWQAVLEVASYYYVEDKSYDAAIAVPLINPAIMFCLAGINDYSTTTTTVQVSGVAISSNVINVSAMGLPFYPVEVHFAVTRADGSYNAGFGLAVSNTQIQAGWPRDPDLFTVALDQAKPIAVSLGWTHFQRREINGTRYKSCFVPALDGLGGVVLPPAPTDFVGSGCDGVGVWYRRAPMSHYFDPRLPYDSDPFIAKGLYREKTEPFTDGDLARIAGDHVAGPSISDAAGLPLTNPADPQLEFWDHFNRGEHPRNIQNQIDQQLTGRCAAGGGTTWFRSPGINWNKPQWYAGGTMRIESGTATGGTTTTFEDTTKATGAAGNCFWAAGRWVNFAGPYRNCVIEWLVGGTDFDLPDSVVEKRLLTATNGGVISGGWTPALSVTADGKKYRIIEPAYELNRFEGCPVAFKRADPATPGTWQTAERIIAGGDDDTQFLTAALPWPADENTWFEIRDERIGDLVKRVSGAWVKATGADTTRYGVSVAADFHPSGFENLPDYVPRYGRYNYRDAVCKRNFDEMIAVFNVLRATGVDFAWTANGQDNMRGNVLYGNDEGESRDWSTLRGDLASDWTGFAPHSVNAPPRAISGGYISLIPSPDSGKQISAERRFAYGLASVFESHCPMSYTVDWYAKSRAGVVEPEGILPPPGDCRDDDLGGGDIRHIWAGTTFNANGDPVLENQFKKWGSTASGTATSVLSPVFGATAFDTPAFVGDPIATAGACFTPSTDNGVTNDYLAYNNEGYEIPDDAQHRRAVLKWAFDDLAGFLEMSEADYLHLSEGRYLDLME